MNPRITLLCLSLLATGTTLADGGTLSFEGQVLEAGCSVTAVSPSQSEPNLMPVSAKLALQIDEENDACSRGYSAFTADYAPLQSSDGEADGMVITLTYN